MYCLPRNSTLFWREFEMFLHCPDWSTMGRSMSTSINFIFQYILRRSYVGTQFLTIWLSILILALQFLPHWFTCSKACASVGYNIHVNAEPRWKHFSISTIAIFILMLSCCIYIIISLRYELFINRNKDIENISSSSRIGYNFHFLKSPWGILENDGLLLSCLWTHGGYQIQLGSMSDRVSRNLATRSTAAFLVYVRRLRRIWISGTKVRTCVTKLSLRKKPIEYSWKWSFPA